MNNLAVLDAPGEYVCTQQGDTATFSWIPPPGTPQEGLVPVIDGDILTCLAYLQYLQVMTKLDIILQMTNVAAVRVEGLSFQHTNYQGLDRNMNWQHAALVAKRTTGLLNMPRILGFSIYRASLFSDLTSALFQE